MTFARSSQAFFSRPRMLQCHGGAARAESGAPPEPMKRRLPIHAIPGLGIVAGAEMLLLAGNGFVASFFTPIVWTGYILVADALVAARTGASPLVSRRLEFALLVPISIASWYLFEGVNLLLRSWEYVGLPGSAAARWVGYAWSYATITPAIFVTALLVESFIGERLRGRAPVRLGPRTETAFFLAGIVLFVVPLLVPSPWLCPLPWVSVLLWFEGMNDRRGIGSFGEQLRAGDWSLLVSLLVSGAVCGLLWEFWNYWAATKWNYRVPYLPDVKLFEMPVLGFLGFPPFALECWLVYRLFRWLTPAPLSSDVLGRPWRAAGNGERP